MKKRSWLDKLESGLRRRRGKPEVGRLEDPSTHYIFPKDPSTPHIPMDEGDVREMEEQLAEACLAAGVPVITFDDLAEHGRRCREQGIDPMTGEPITDDERDAKVQEIMGRFVERTREESARRAEGN